MAETVGQHSVAAFTSPVNGTTPIDANTVRGNDNTVRVAYVDHDADPGIHVQSSTLASRPVAGTVGRKWITVSSGRYQFWYDDGSRWHEVAADAVNVDCLADANLAKGDVVKITGFDNGQNLPTVNKVTASTDVAFGIVENTVTSGNIVQIVNTGLIEDVDTNGYAVGTILYPNTSGGWTTTKPTSGSYQPAGFVLRGNTNNGVLYVEFSAPRIVERSDNTASTIVLRDSNGDFAAGTITATAVNTTTIDLTNLEVTNIKAKDGTASATIADSTGVMTIGSSVLTTTDINGGTIDGTTIGGASAAAGTFTTVAATTGNITTVNATTVDTTNIEVTNVKAKDGTASIAIADSTGVATITAAPVLSALTASQAVFTDASKGLVSNAITGTGNVVMSASPTLTGTVTAATINATTLGGTLSTAAQTNITSVGTLTGLTVTNPITGSVTGSSGSTTGNAATATALQTARNINGVSFNGTADITVTAAAGTLTGTTLASGVTASSLTSVGTLSSLTVSGAATFASTTGNVGIGTTNPVDTGGFGKVLDIQSSTGAQVVCRDSDDTTKFGRLSFDGGTTNVASIGAEGTGTQVAFRAGGGEKMRLDASGNLGLGVTPSAWNSSFPALQIGQGAAFWAAKNFPYAYMSANAVYDGTGANKYIVTGAASWYVQETGAHKWFNAPSGTAGNTITFTQAMTLDASGNLGVGTASPSGTGKSVEISGSGDATVKVTGGTGGNAYLQLNAGSSSNAYINSVGSGALIFGANGVASSHARITSGGTFCVAKTSDDDTIVGMNFRDTGYGTFTRSSSSNSDSTVHVYSTGAGAYRFYVGMGGTVYATNTTISAISDARLKENVRDLDVGLDAILALKPRTFDWKEGKGTDKKDVRGFIAQEFEEVFPDLVDEWKDEAPEGEEPYRSIRQDLIPVLVKAIQELDAKNKALEARLEALEA